MKSITPNAMLPEPWPYILLIDDDEDDLEMLSSSLEGLGVKTRSFESGEKALFYLQLISDTAKLPVMVILDYNMPGMNGQQILISIKTNNVTKDIPVVMYSTCIPFFTKKAQLDLGALNCYIKPFSYIDFTTQVGIFKDLAYSFMPTN